jgi:hypothetical protein
MRRPPAAPEPPAPPTTPTATPRRRRLIGVLAIAALMGVAVTFVPAPKPAAAAGGCPWPVDRNGDCPVDKTLPVPGTSRPAQPGPTAQDPSNPSHPGATRDTGYYCEWHQYPDQAHWRTVFPEAPPDAVFGEYHCFQDGFPLYGPYVPRFIAPNSGIGPFLPPPTPAEVAADAEVSVRALLRRPTIATNPPDPAPSTIAIPTFVSITNWQGVLTPPDHCLRGVCVSLRAEPKLTFDPGETGADPIACEDGGTVFDPHGADPEVQARPPACAYAYKLRTGVAGRPAAWTAEATITWTVTWTGGGETGTLGPISLSNTFDQAVVESNTLITDFSD